MTGRANKNCNSACKQARKFLALTLLWLQFSKQVYIPLLPQTTRANEKLNTAAEALHPIWTISGSPCMSKPVISPSLQRAQHYIQNHGNWFPRLAQSTRKLMLQRSKLFSLGEAVLLCTFKLQKRSFLICPHKYGFDGRGQSTEEDPSRRPTGHSISVTNCFLTCAQIRDVPTWYPREVSSNSVFYMQISLNGFRNQFKKLL